MKSLFTLSRKKLDPTDCVNHLKENGYEISEIFTPKIIKAFEQAKAFEKSQLDLFAKTKETK